MYVLPGALTSDGRVRGADPASTVGVRHSVAVAAAAAAAASAAASAAAVASAGAASAEAEHGASTVEAPTEAGASAGAGAGGSASGVEAAGDVGDPAISASTGHTAAPNDSECDDGSDDASGSRKKQRVEEPAS